MGMSDIMEYEISSNQFIHIFSLNIYFTFSVMHKSMEIKNHNFRLISSNAEGTPWSGNHAFSFAGPLSNGGGGQKRQTCCG